MRAPSRASETVSVPMWHCRCTASRPAMSPSRGQVEADDVAQERRILGEARDRVARRRDVGGDALVPVRPVDVAIVRLVAHRASIAEITARDRRPTIPGNHRLGSHRCRRSSPTPICLRPAPRRRPGAPAGDGARRAATGASRCRDRDDLDGDDAVQPRPARPRSATSPTGFAPPAARRSSSTRSRSPTT